MSINFTQRTNFNAIFLYIAIMLHAPSAFSNSNRSEIRINDIPYYTEKMRLSSDATHDEGRKYIGVAVPSLKSDHYTMRLDSIDKKTDLQRKEFYYYDENFRIALIHETVYAWDLEWINWWQFFYEYNDLGYITLAYDNRWDNATKEWVPYRKYEYTYNESNNIILYVSYSWNIENKEWRFIGKDEYTYTQFFIHEIISSQWMHPFEEEPFWQLQSKNEYIYNDKRRLTEIIEASWRVSSEEWRLKYRTVYDRGGPLGKILVETFYEMGDEDWIEYKKYENTYPSDNNFNILTKKGSQFNWWETQQWENMDSLVFTYHPVSGSIESETFYGWRAQDSIWLFSHKDDYLYDENFNLINYQLKRWSQIQNDWEPYIEEQASFNSSNLSAEYIVKPFWYEWTNMIDEYKRRLWEFDNWKEINHRTFYYSPLDVTSVTENLKEELKIYPNPAREYIFVDLSGIKTDAVFELYDLTGKRIITRTVSGSSQISLDGLRKGLYLYIITMPGQHRFSGKLAVTE